MLRELRVRNYAIIDELSVRLGPGLNALTGETGAGKSIIIGALGIALGQRAYTEMIKTGHAEASVEAAFDAEESSVRLLEALGIAQSDEIIVRRIISSSGKSKAYINDTMVGLQGLSDLGRTLVDMHGQHEHQSLLSSENQMRLLDRYGGLDEDRAEVEAFFEDVQSLKRDVDSLKTGIRDRAQRLDLLRFQINEIETLSPEAGEDARLEDEIGVLSNLSRLRELAEETYGLLYGSEGSCLEKLSSSLSRLKEISSIDKSAEELAGILESALPLVEDASLSLRGLRDKYEADPERLALASDRLETIKNLKKKYGGSIEAALDYKSAAARELGGIETSDDRLEEMERELSKKEAALEKKALELSGKRKSASLAVRSSILPVLRELAMEKAGFEIDVRPVPITSSGMDAVEFLFSANKGEALKPISKVASGGELSRIMLAVKSILREADKIPVLIFDEVDSGIGGKTAGNVAHKLKDLSAGRQVICITHLAQIASLADSHFLIEKADRKDGVRVTLRELTGEERQREIARMLSGTVTETSIMHAKEIMNKAKGAKGGQTLFGEI